MYLFSLCILMHSNIMVLKWMRFILYSKNQSIVVLILARKVTFYITSGELFNYKEILGPISNLQLPVFSWLVGWLVVLMINVDLAIFQPYLDLEAGDNQSLKIQVAMPEIEPWSSCSASQELNHSATAAPACV